MKYFVLILLIFYFLSCKKEYTADDPWELVKNENRIATPEWVEDAVYQNPDLIIAELEMGVAGYTNGYGLKAVLPTTGMTLIEDRHIYRWGLPGKLGEVRRVMKFNCPQGNKSYTSDFWVKRSKGVPALMINDYFFPGMLAQKLYKRTAEGLVLVTTTTKENFFITNSHHYTDSPDNGPYYGGDTMYISKRSLDFYYGYLFVETVGDFLIWTKTDPYNFFTEPNENNNFAKAGISVDASGIVTWNQSVESDSPAPVHGLEALVDKSGQYKTVSLIWGCPNDVYEIYRDGVLVGTSDTNGAVLTFKGSVRGTYKVVSVIEGVGTSEASITVK